MKQNFTNKIIERLNNLINSLIIETDNRGLSQLNRENYTSLIGELLASDLSEYIGDHQDRKDFSDLRASIRKAVIKRIEELAQEEEEEDNDIMEFPTILTKLFRRKEDKNKYTVLVLEMLDKLLNLMEVNINSVVLIVDDSSLIYVKDSNKYTLHHKRLGDLTKTIEGENLTLCQNVPFLNEPVFDKVLGTGFFVKENMILTAGHVVAPHKYRNKLDNLRFIVGVNNKSYNSIDPSSIYKIDINCNNCIELENTRLRNDWALIQVKSLSGKGFKSPLPKLRMNSVKYKQKIYCVGHGFGLPQKVSYQGKVIQYRSSKPRFECHMDVFAGNSGSPVCDARTHEVIGMVIGGTYIPFLTTEKENLKCFGLSHFRTNYEGEECQIINHAIYSKIK